jgi:toxin ParE1/3/4
VRLAVVLRDEAELEFDEAFDWYQNLGTKLGIKFVEEVQKTFDRISLNPLMHSIVFADVRKAVVRKFPYSVFYRSQDDRVEVLAVFHSSRNPEIWQARA